jgi:hypothetical protein
VIVPQPILDARDTVSRPSSDRKPAQPEKRAVARGALLAAIVLISTACNPAADEPPAHGAALPTPSQLAPIAFLDRAPHGHHHTNATMFALGVIPGSAICVWNPKRPEVPARRIFQTKDGYIYQAMLRAIHKGKAALDARPRMNMPGGKAIPQKRDFGKTFL